MPSSKDSKKVTNNDLRNAQFAGGLINADTVNAGQIGGDIYNTHLSKQTTAAVNQNTQPQKILILAAIPHGLRLDREIREIESAIRRATRRDLFEIRIRTVPIPEKISWHGVSHKPELITFLAWHKIVV